MTHVAPRPPGAVRALEDLQRHERRGAVGVDDLASEQFDRLLREDIKLELTKEAYDGGIIAMAEATMDEAKIDRLVAERKRQFEVDDPAQWSRFETVGSRFGLADACSRIEQAFAGHGWQLREFPAVGTLSTGQVGATTQRGPGGEALVLVDNGFPRFSGTLAQLAVQASLEAEHGVAFTAPTLQLLSDLVATHVVIGTCLYLDARTLDPSIRDAVHALQDATTVFVLAHEYAHIALEDLDASPGASRHDLEFRADAYGLVTAVETTHTAVSPADGVYGAFLYLAGLDLMARADAVYSGAEPPETSDRTYPTPIERADHLLSMLAHPSSFANQFPAQVRDATRCYELIIAAWDYIQPALAASRNALAIYEGGSEEDTLPEYASGAVTMLLWRAVQERR